MKPPNNSKKRPKTVKRKIEKYEAMRICYQCPACKRVYMTYTLDIMVTRIRCHHCQQELILA